MQLLNLQGIGAYGSDEELRSNIVSALARGLPEVSVGPVVHDGTFVIVGSGPSLPQFVEDIRREQQQRRTICAVKGAYDYLVERGIVPDAYFNLEARLRALKSPQQATLFLLASRCSPEQFDQLQGKQVQMFHTWDGKEPVPELKGRPLLTGGSTSGLRAITVGYAWGFRRFSMYGFDSCITDDNVKRVTGEAVEPHKTLQVKCGDRWWKTNGAMALQAQDFRDLLALIRGVEFAVHGDGLLAAIHREWTKMRAAA
jgi:uncharacterized Rossmann fold enzyme